MNEINELIQLLNDQKNLRAQIEELMEDVKLFSKYFITFPSNENVIAENINSTIEKE